MKPKEHWDTFISTPLKWNHHKKARGPNLTCSVNDKCTIMLPSCVSGVPRLWDIYIFGYGTRILTSLARRLLWNFHILWLIEYDFKFVQHVNMLSEEAGIIFRYISLSNASFQNGFMYAGMKRVPALNLNSSDQKKKQLKLNYSPGALKLRRWLKIAVCEASEYREICLLH